VVKKKLVRFFVFGYFIRLTIQTYLLTMISALLNIIMAGEEDYTTSFNQISYTLAVLFLVRPLSLTPTDLRSSCAVAGILLHHEALPFSQEVQG